MTSDRYVRVVLTIIAAALVYIAVVLTPLPGASAQQFTQRPGEPSGPVEVFLVGWSADVPPLAVQMATPVQVEGTIETRQPPNSADRVVLVGWEERATEALPGPFRALDRNEAGLPSTTVPAQPR